jgi:serine protease Do
VTIKRKTGLAILALALGLALGPALGGPAAAADLPGSFAELAEEVSPAVVNIRTTKTVQGGPMGGLFGMRPRGQEGPGRQGPGQAPPDLHEFFRRFFGGPEGGRPPQEFKQRALGTGVIVDEEGYVLTNNHVIAGADEILVKLKNGEEYQAEIRGRDKKTDLALIKIKADHDLPYLTLGDSDDLRVGDWVLAVGNPFGLENTVTAGIVSAKQRVIGAGPYDDFIQTDASINPGNSGGPLIDMEGRVVGINTAIVAQGQGIGFAIPINLAKSVMRQLRDKGRVVRGWLGVYIQPVTPELAEKFGLEGDQGALVADVVNGSPADKAGLKRGDVIVAYNGREVGDTHALPRMVAATPVGEKAEVTVIRGGETKELTVTIGELKEDQMAAAEPGEAGPADLGMSVQTLTPELAQQLGVDQTEGAVITQVEQNSPADEAGLSRGDVILEAAQKEISGAEEFREIAGRVKPGQGLLLLIQRRGNTLFVVVKRPQ